MGRWQQQIIEDTATGNRLYTIEQVGSRVTTINHGLLGRDWDAVYEEDLDSVKKAGRAFEAEVRMALRDQ